MGAETWLVRYRYVGLTRGNRRDFIILAGGAIALPSPSRAQQPAKLPSNGFLGPSTQVNLDHSANSRRAEAACGIDPVGVSHVFASRHQHAFARQPSGRHFLVRCLSESRPGSRAGMLQSSITGRPSAVCVHCEGAFHPRGVQIRAGGSRAARCCRASQPRHSKFHRWPKRELINWMFREGNWRNREWHSESPPAPHGQGSRMLSSRPRSSG